MALLESPAYRRRKLPARMTSAATVFGHLRLVLVSGPGAEARNSIGTILVSGYYKPAEATVLASWREVAGSGLVCTSLAGGRKPNG